MKRARRIGLGFLLLGAASSGWAADAQGLLEVESLTPDSPFEANLQEQTMVATNGASITYHDPQRGPVVLTAKVVRLNQKTGEAMAEGNVTLRSEGQLWTGDRLEYNLHTRTIKSDSFRTGLRPIFATGQRLSLYPSNQVYNASGATITTDDVSEPAFYVRAKKITVRPGESISARNATLYAGKVPIMYFPYYERNLKRHPNNWVFEPGYRTLHGPYLLSKYNFQLIDQASTGINLDYRMERGLAGGPDIEYNLGRAGTGEGRFYYAEDNEPGEDPAGAPIDGDRHRISFSHQVTIRTNLTAKAVVREQSDAYIVRDFFESEYRRNVQPNTFVEVNQFWRNWSLDAMAQPQVNDFYETVERLPDVKLTGVRQQLGVSPFYYESESSAGYFRYKFADDRLPYYEAARADTYHQITLPHNFLGWLNVTPRAGYRLTYYTEADGDQANTREQYRNVFNTGMEVSTKASRVWRGVQNRFFEVNELRHITEPSVNYVYVPEPDVLPRELPQFDSELPSYRLLPIEYPDYNAIDSIDSQNVLRLGWRNKLQTKREDRIDNLVHWAVYTDWRVRPRKDQSTFADMYSDLDFKPRRWLMLTSETRYDMQNERWRMANHYLTLQPGSDWSLSLGHRYLRSEPDYTGNNLIMTRLYYRLNENWGVRLNHHFEARDGVMEEQYYTIYRDLRSWTSALTFRIRESRQGETDYTVAVTFSLKAFPRFKLNQDTETPWTLLD